MATIFLFVVVAAVLLELVQLRCPAQWCRN